MHQPKSPIRVATSTNFCIRCGLTQCPGLIGVRRPLHKTANKHAKGVDGCDVPGTPCQHEGYPGFRTTDLTAGVVDKIGVGYPIPDVVLLQIGTNDIGRNNYPNASFAASETAKNLKILIAAIFAKAPSTHVFVASILAMPASVHFYHVNKANLTAQEIAYNAVVPGVVASFGAEKATFVDMKHETGLCDMNTASPPGCCPPQLHPNGIGYSRMAAVWHRVVAGHASR